MDSNKKLKELIENLTELDNVLSIGFIGSYSETSDLSQCRDVDLLVIIDGEGRFQREIYSEDYLEFDISYITIEEIKNQISKRSRIWVKAIKDYSVILNLNEEISREIIQIKEKVDEIYNKCDKINDLQDFDTIKFLRYDISNKLEYLISKKEDIVVFNNLKDSFILDLISLYFEINNKVIPKVKNQINEIRKSDDLLYKIIENYYTSNLINRETILFEIMDYVLKDYGGRLYKFEKGFYPVDR